MSLKAALTIGGLASAGVATVSVAYVATTGQGGKTKVWFDENGACNYHSPSVFSTGKIGREDAASADKNVCKKLLEGNMDWNNVEIIWDNVSEKYKAQKTEYDSWKQSQATT